MRTILFICIVTLFGCNSVSYETPKPSYSGGFKTIHIRNMWNSCFGLIKRSSSGVNPRTAALHCDCIVDKTRDLYDFKTFKTLDSYKTGEAFKDISLECFLKNNPSARS